VSQPEKSKPIRALIIAEAANPEWVSVPLEGWSHSQALATVCDTHLVTQIRNREAILRAGLEEGRDFTAIDSERVAARISRLSNALHGKGKGWTLGTALQSASYRYFERCLWKEFGARIRSGEFDVVHRITPLSPTIASPLAARCKKAGVPFVWGPINGGVPWPKEFNRERRREQEWLSYLRDGYKLIPGYHATRRNAAAIIVGSRDTRAQLDTRYHAKSVYIPENAIEPERFSTERTRTPDLPLRVAFTGRLVPYKGADMLIEAAAPLAKAGKLTLDIMGDGPEMSRLQALASEYGLNQSVRLDGWVEHADLQDRLAQADVFGFPSVREFGGAVVLEAMALGLVPVILDYAGPSELVTEATGFKVPLGNRDAVVQGFRSVLERLVAEPGSLEAVGRRARQRVFQHFTWEAKAQQTRDVYRWVIGHTDKQPDFGIPLPDAE
jgi:glycosyltransferase involved in cell wall biosynthesis